MSPKEPAQKITSLRWKIVLEADIKLVSPTTVEYPTTLALLLETRANENAHYERVTDSESPAFRALASEINSQLLAEYKKFFSESYGLTFEIDKSRGG